MKINPIINNRMNTNFKNQKTIQSFGSYSACVLGHDGAMDSDVRRRVFCKDLDVQITEYQPLWDSEFLNGVDLKKNVRKFKNICFLPPRSLEIQKDDLVDRDILNGMGLYNLKCLNENLDGYSGSTLAEGNTKNKVKELKAAGIKSVIDFVSYKKIKEACEEEGLEYFSGLNIGSTFSFVNNLVFIPKDEYMSKVKKHCLLTHCGYDELEDKMEEAEKEHKQATDSFVQDLKDFISIVNRGNFYMCCEYGTTCTGNAIKLNNLFNPEELLKGPSDIGTFEPFIKGLMKNMSGEDKKYFGLIN